MKKLFVWIIMFPLFFSCEKSLQVNDPATRDVTLSKNNSTGKMVERPIKVDFYSTPDKTLPPVQCIPVAYGVVVGGGGWIHGNCSHLGLVDPGNSPFKVVNCMLGPGPGQSTSILEGQIASASGDLIFYTATTLVEFSDNTFTGTVTITGGSGRFTNSYGVTNIRGTVNFVTGVLAWTGEGTITY